MPTKLTNLRVDEISMVDKGANPGARVYLFKRDTPELSALTDAIEKIGAKVSADRLVRLKAAAEALMAVIAEVEAQPAEPAKPAAPTTPLKVAAKRGKEIGIMPTAKALRKGALPSAVLSKLPPQVSDLIASYEEQLGITTLAPDILAALPKEAQDYIASLEAKVQELTDEDAAEDAADGETEATEGAEPQAQMPGGAMIPATKRDVAKSDDIWKGVNPQIREIVEKAQAEASEVRAQLAKVQDDVLTRAYIAKAASFKALPVKAAEFGPVLKALAATVSPATFAELERVLKAADAGMANGKSSPFREVGVAGVGAGGSAWDQIEAAASGIIAKSAGSNLTREQAIARVMTEQPSLYDQFLKDQTAQ